MGPCLDLTGHLGPILDRPAITLVLISVSTPVQPVACSAVKNDYDPAHGLIYIIFHHDFAPGMFHPTIGYRHSAICPASQLHPRVTRCSVQTEWDTKARIRPANYSPWLGILLTVFSVSTPR